MDDVDTFLEHFGVRGMKWGIRKKVVEARANKAPKELSDETTSARNTKEKIRTKGLGSVSNAELKAYNERLNLEQNYKQMMQKQANPRSVGKKFAAKIVSGAANQIVSQLTSVVVKNLVTNPADAKLKQLLGGKEDTKIPGM